MKTQFENISKLVKKLADEEKFHREETTYNKPFGGVDKSIAYISQIGDERYEIEKYVSNPEPMDLIQERLTSYNLSINRRGRAKEFDDSEHDIEKLYSYVKKKSKRCKTTKNHSSLLKRMGI